VLQWTESGNMGGADEVEYIVEIKKVSQNFREAQAVITGTQATVSDLEPGLKYHFRVMSKNAMQSSVYSNEIMVDYLL